MLILAITKAVKKFSKDSSTRPPSPSQCRHRDEPSSAPCADCQAEAKASSRYRWKLILGLALPFSLQALDSTIIASALPWIASDFGEISQLNWIVSAFSLCSAAFIPCWAQMADVFGRNAAINAAIIIMIVGSALCTAAPTDAFPVLLLGRGFQGVAAAGINVVIRTILADRVSLADSAKNWSTLAMVGSVAYGIGRLTRVDWRWCFAINLPIAVLGLIVIFFLIRKELLGPQPIPDVDDVAQTGRRARLATRLSTIDVGGQLLFLFSFGLVILGLTWGGATYGWNSPAVITPLAVGLVLIGCFLAWERSLASQRFLSRALPQQKAMIPWPLLTNRDIGIIFFTETTTGICMNAVLYFCSIYFIAVRNYDADESGVQLLFFLPGLLVGVILCMFMCNKSPRMTFPPILLGTIIEALGVGLLAYALYIDNLRMIFGMMALVGVGCGIRFMAAPLHGVGIFRQHRAPIIGLLSVAFPFGGTLGLTIMSAVFNNTSGLDSHEADFSQLHSQPQELRDQAVENAKMGVVWAFVAITPLLIMSILFACCLGNVKLTNQDDDHMEAGNNVTTRPYLLALLSKDSATDEEEKGYRLQSLAASPQDDALDRMSDSSDEQSPDPKLWLEFRTFDDGFSNPTPTTNGTPRLTTFPLFARLPAELRIKIWSHLVQPRIVVVSCLQRDEQLAQRRRELDDRTHAANTPALLHVNREARDVGLRHYELTFSWKVSKLLSDTPTSQPAQVWFNYDMDTLYLTGELEAHDSYGFNSPMVYFLRREDTRRVKHIACAFAELGYPEQESDQIFGCLWHVVDRFQGVERLLLAVRDADEVQIKGCLLPSTDNVMQKIWNGWMCGTTITNTTMANKQMLLVKEQDMAEFIAGHQY
ncbi:major facilitator superfamily domain-containing protein [Stachybotrys elegans]|uniref:Major facilitator superfamily domain-containing protein n=1 Tax=Stachybotrys elegans TaxID=80388 RepID=A0A8K0SU98_9HYPO|nr:major facilitator superfamily domain-containing protein [Stachybotrys elegans]